MKNTLSFDVLSCVNQVYGRMQDNYKFAYPGDNFESSRAHQILCRFGTFSSFIHTLLQSENFDTDNAVDSIYFQQILANSKIIAFDKDWSYPGGNLSTNRVSTSLNCIESSIRNYDSSIKILGNHCFKDKTVAFNLIHFIEKISCNNFYNYAYPDNNYSSEKGHPALQMLLTLTECTMFVFNNIKTDNPELEVIIKNSFDKVQTCKEYLNKAYPNGSFNSAVGHSCLSQFINAWKNFKEISLTSLKTYFEKQNIIKEYENKLKEHNIISSQSTTPDNIEPNNDIAVEVTPVDTFSTPIIKKVKSLL